MNPILLKIIVSSKRILFFSSLGFFTLFPHTGKLRTNSTNTYKYWRTFDRRLFERFRLLVTGNLGKQRKNN